MALTDDRAGARVDPDFLDQQGKTPRLVGVAWLFLVINTLGSIGSPTILPIPRSAAQLLTMGAVLVSFLLALLLNPRLRVRPSAYLLLFTLLLIVAIASSARLESGYGALFRSGRLTVFVATLWLLSAWWNDPMRFVFHHIKALSAVLATVALGLVVAPGLALPAAYDGRLVGAVWPMSPPQIGQYAATAAGLTILLRLGRRTDRWSALLLVGPALILLLLSHTRTAMIGFVAGLTVALLSMLLTSARARRVFTWSAVVVGVVVVTLGGVIQAWLQRGQDAEALANLTGRQKVWDALLNTPRSTLDQLFGVGLTNKSFNGLPIDSSWLAVYLEQGLVGVILVALFLITLVVVAALRPPSLERALAMFLIVYVIAASYTEAGLGDASPYLLSLAVAAALLSGSARSRTALAPGVVGSP